VHVLKKGTGMREKGTKGFTLVELIVVIAIIAVLSAVTLVGFNGFIDQARFSNDTQYVENMNRLLEPIFIENPDIDPESLDAFDVRELLNAFSDTPFDFTPRSRNAGFFYLKEYGRVVVSKYDDITSLDVTELGFEPTIRLLNGTTVPEDIEAPEALFGNDRLLLTTSGSTVANIVWFEAVIRTRYWKDLTNLDFFKVCCKIAVTKRFWMTCLTLLTLIKRFTSITSTGGRMLPWSIRSVVSSFPPGLEIYQLLAITSKVK